MHVDDALTDIERYDMGVRWGDQVAKHLLAVRIGPDMRRVIVAAPGYLESRGAPASPQKLTEHNCIALRLPGGGVDAWELNDGHRALQVRIDGRTIFNGMYQVLTAALDGLGLAYIPEDLAQPHVDEGRLCYVLEPWFPIFPGLHAY